VTSPRDTRLIGKVHQAVKFKDRKNWAELKDVLKSALEPQRTITYLFSELYSLRQKVGEDITTYANRIEQLKTLMIEQDTSECNWEVAQVLGTSIRKQTIQVYVEDLGPLKDFIKARNPLMLDKPIQSAREEERVRNSQEVTKKLYGLHTNPRRNLFASIAVSLVIWKSIAGENRQ